MNDTINNDTDDNTDDARSTALLDELASLASPPPAELAESLRDRLFDRWLSTESPLGPVLVAYTTRGVSFVRTSALVPGEQFLETHRRRFGRPLRRADSAPSGLVDALWGRPGAAPEVDLEGLSAFEHDVLAATRTIPLGETRPYAWVAREAGSPRAVRAAGSVLARNPVPLLVPCHRVVRSDGSPGQYLFGPETKQRLLSSEHARAHDL
ncbi:methylated-DNA-[protein]-cysteine S-methyltransferase [Actinomycetospora succinea]|uniref:Methylated-DNA-[protein]-cysteine S-methyltransferase n=1 Tax=Actinomycetospora succinea TaxID=663603 RepID=A0A4R6VDZ1_9PSEU|nr:MGMT family protein [Actinomycetospora succinea]TDQ60962.1 methylated-DNA-[protein]-cysteine S-methyltransferase [Actinomycetospora succinea]